MAASPDKRWDITGSPQLYLGEFVAGRTGGDASSVLVTTDIRQVDRIMAGDFVEWLRTMKVLAYETIRSRTSSLLAFWTRMDRRDFVEGSVALGSACQETKPVRKADKT